MGCVCPSVVVRQTSVGMLVGRAVSCGGCRSTGGWGRLLVWLAAQRWGVVWLCCWPAGEQDQVPRWLYAGQGNVIQIIFHGSQSI